MVIYAVVSILCLAVVFSLWVRFAPVDVAAWHPGPDQAALGVGDHAEAGAFLAVREVSLEDVERLVSVIEATARTRLLAGDSASGLVTYETRSRVMGFPDYTTLRFEDGVLRLYGRLRFGQYDMGVNRGRITGWLQAAGID